LSVNAASGSLRRVPFLYLRHGETDWNREDRAQGQIDIPLNERGQAQAAEAARALAGVEITTILSSPLSRALDTARAVERVVGAPLHVMDVLKECAWGEMEGSIKGPWYEDWKSGRNTPKGAESYPEFQARMIDGFNAALAYPGPVLIVGHGGTFGTLRGPCGLDPNYSIPNATPVRLTPPESGDIWQLEELSPPS